MEPAPHNDETTDPFDELIVDLISHDSVALWILPRGTGTFIRSYLSVCRRTLLGLGKYMMCVSFLICFFDEWMDDGLDSTEVCAKG